MKMMIVDDSMVIRRKIERSEIAATMTKVVQAHSGSEAVRVFEQERPDLVTMDLTMPEMDGVECVRELVNRKPDIRILVVSALSDKSTGLKAIKNGARGFLTKPFTEEQLCQALRSIVEH